MKKNRIINTLIVLLMAITTTLTTSCEEDAPEFAHSLGELDGTWTWETREGDDFSDFEVTITSSGSYIEIENFANTDETMRAKVSGETITFEGELNGGNMVITEGTGTLTNGWATIDISFLYDIGDGPQSCRASIQNTKMISKKQQVSAR